MKKGKTFKIGSIIVWSAISVIDLIAGLVKASDAICGYYSMYSGYSDKAVQACFEVFAPYAGALALFAMLFIIQFGIADIISQLEIRNASANSLPAGNRPLRVPDTAKTGTQQLGTWYCVQCGKPNSQANEFCIGCGKHR